MAVPMLYTKVVGLVPPGKYRYATPAAVIAVCLQESNGQPIFVDNEPLLQVNLVAAMEGTGLPKQMLLDAMRIQEGPLVGLLARFRFEPAYWEWTAMEHLPSVTLRFMCSCSIGLGQQMMRWVLPGDEIDWLEFIENFKEDVDLQLGTLIVSLERLLESSEGDLFRAYKGYNSGNINSTNPDVVARANNVVKLRNTVQQQLQG